MYKFFCSVLLALCLLSAEAQVDSLLQSTEELNDMLLNYVETILDDEEQSESVDLSDELSELEAPSDGRWSVNTLSYEVAVNVLHLTDYQYYQLQVYKEKYGALVTLNELLAVEGFTYDDWLRLHPLLEATPPLQRRQPFRHFFKRARQTLLLRYGRVLEKQAGYDVERTNGYLGSPDRLAFRYQFMSSDVFSLGLAAEKDAGEQFFKGVQRQGFDHYSFSMAFKNIGILKCAAIGDYRLNLGQGLVVGSSLMSGRGGGVGLRKFSSGVKPVTPLSEGLFFRGAAVELGNANYTGTVFYSSRRYDGKINGDGTYEGPLSQVGYHRTANECAKMNVLRNHVVGADFRMVRRLFRVGARVLWAYFPRKVMLGDAVYQQYNFTGNYMFNASVDYQCLLRKVILFGELAMCESPAWACLQGLQWHVDPRLQVAALFRHFSPRYHALYGSGFGGKAQNETGIYVVADVVVGKRLNLLLYHDYCHYPWLKYQVDAPSSRMETGMTFTLDIRRQTRLKWQYRRLQRDVNRTSENGYWNALTPKITHSFKMGFSYQPFPVLSMKTELDWLLNRYPSEKTTRQGWLFYQDVNVTFPKPNISVKCRLAFFDTPSYDERLYAYESDVLYAFTVNSYYGRGCRAVLVLKYRWRFLDVWVRLAQSYYFYSDKVGSGLTQINGHHKTELRLQCCFRL